MGYEHEGQESYKVGYKGVVLGVPAGVSQGGDG